MKLPALLLPGSLVANLALFGALAWRPTLAPLAFRDFFARNFHAPAEVAAVPRPATGMAGAAPANCRAEAKKSTKQGHHPNDRRESG